MDEDILSLYIESIGGFNSDIEESYLSICEFRRGLWSNETSQLSDYMLRLMKSWMYMPQIEIILGSK